MVLEIFIDIDASWNKLFFCKIPGNYIVINNFKNLKQT